MTLQSKFKRRVFIPVFCGSFSFSAVDAGYFFVALITVPACVLFLPWIVSGELRTKAIRISIHYDRIQVRRFLGYRTPEEFLFLDMEGFKIVLLPAEYRDYESLSLIKNGQRMVKLSEYYHENHFELKENISSKWKKLKEEKYNFLKEIKEIWK